MIDSDFTIQTLQKLVRINSVNPELEATGGGELEIGRFIYGLLRDLDIDAELDELAPGRVNVTGILNGRDAGKSIMLNAHTDTVGVKGMEDPFSGRFKNGRVYGRGAYDMKGSIAAILGAAKAIKENNRPPKGNVVLSFVADEEYESIGAQALIKKIKTDAAIVTEPTNLSICTAHRGFGICKITTKGKTAHGGNHHLGIDANMHMGLLLAELYALSEETSKKKAHPLCGEASLHVPLVNGGQSLFIYASECTIYVERRTLPGETSEAVEEEIEGIMRRLARQCPGFEAKMEPVIWRSPYEIDQKAAIVQQLAASLSDVTGEEPGYIGHTWWEDSAIFGEAGIETVIFGPKGGGIHEEVEWVDTGSVIDLAGVLLSVCTR